MSISEITQKIKIFFSKAKRPGLFREQIKVFFFLLFGLATLHQIRSGWSFGSKYMQKDTGFSDHDVGLTNMFFLLFLGIGFEINGHLGDKKSPKHFALLGMLVASFAIVFIFIVRACGSKNVYVYTFFQAINGFFESMGFPSFLRILGSWFSERNRGFIIALWAGGKNLGDIIGSLIGDLMILRIGASWYGTMLLFACFCFVSQILIYKFVENNPGIKGYQINKRQNQEQMVENKENNQNPGSSHQQQNNKQDINHVNDENNINIDLSDKQNVDQQSNSMKKDNYAEQRIAEIESVYESNKQEAISNAQDNIQEKPQGDEKLKTLTIRQALSIPGVPFFILGYMCIKSLNYGLIFWLPKYLQDNGLESISSSVYVVWSLGVFVGGLFSGYLGDKFKKRALLMPPSLLLLIFCLLCFSYIPLDTSKSSLFMFVAFLMGLFQGSPQNVISGPLLVDLGKHPKLKGKAQAVGTVTGLIEGSASLCASLIQLVIPSIGEKNIFILFMLMTFASFISLIPVALNEFLALQKEKKIKKKQEAQQQLQQQEQKLSNSMQRQQQQIQKKDYLSQQQQNDQITKYSDNSDQKFNTDTKVQFSLNSHEDQQNKSPSVQLNFGYDKQNNHHTNSNTIGNDKHGFENQVRIQMNQYQNKNDEAKENKDNFNFIAPANIQFGNSQNEQEIFNKEDQESQLHKAAKQINNTQKEQKYHQNTKKEEELNDEDDFDNQIIQYQDNESNDIESNL